MADIELVIKISEDIYKRILPYKDEPIISNHANYLPELTHAVANGTPLPKGHGRILDEKDIFDTKNNDGGWYDLVDMPEYIAGVKAIIEADKEQEE